MDSADLATVLGLPGPGPAPEVSIVGSNQDRVVVIVDGGLTLRCPWRTPNGWNGATVLLPWYDVESMFADVVADPERTADRKKLPVADELLAHGFAIVVVPWWAEELGKVSPHKDLHGRYGVPAAEALAAGWRTGLGRSLRDIVVVLDAIATQAGTLAIWGHSLAGKLALFGAAVDDRLRACVTHELGLGWEHSNWFDPWYFGEIRPDFDCDAVLRLVAPRPLLYGAGHGFDGAPSIALAESAADGTWRPEIVEHHDGHRPGEAVRQQTYRWLAQVLATEPQRPTTTPVG